MIRNSYSMIPTGGKTKSHMIIIITSLHNSIVMTISDETEFSDDNLNTTLNNDSQSDKLKIVTTKVTLHLATPTIH